MKVSRFFHVAIVFVAMFVLGACAPAPTPTPVPTPVPPTATRVPPTNTPVPPTATTAPTAAPAALTVEITVNLGPGRDGDQSPGTAVLTAQGTKTQVTVNIKPAAAGVSQPGHIHEGACPGVGAVKYPLTNAVDGKSTTVVDVSLKDLLRGGFAVNLHKSTQEAGVYVACGNIPKGTVIELGKGRDADETPATAVLVSAGAKTDVYVYKKPGPSGVAQPGHIHDGSCPGVGAVKFPLTNAVDGKSKTTVDVSLDDLLMGTYAVNLHKSTAEVGVYVACGNVK